VPQSIRADTRFRVLPLVALLRSFAMAEVETEVDADPSGALPVDVRQRRLLLSRVVRSESDLLLDGSGCLGDSRAQHETHL
jgi:hypothetical protein